jgi:hypothetical protein
MSMCRVTGVVKDHNKRTGTNDRGPWEMRSARVLIADLDFTEVTLTDGQDFPPIGSPVDWIVDVTGGGRFARIGFVKDWPVPALASKS